MLGVEKMDSREQGNPISVYSFETWLLNAGKEEVLDMKCLMRDLRVNIWD